MKIELWFSEAKALELQKISHSLDRGPKPRQAVRGKSAGAFFNSESFQWTPAVKALAILFLRAAESPSRSPLLEGGNGTPASSLAYALSKQPQWLLDIFGCDQRGRSRLRRILRLSNGNRKRKGPTAISLSRSAQQEVCIEIYLGKRKVSEPSELKRLSKTLFDAWKPQRSGIRKASESSSKEPTDGFRAILSELFFQETLESLWRTDIFSTKAATETLTRLAMNPFVQSLPDDTPAFLHEIDRELCTSACLGLLNNESSLRSALNRSEPLRCAIPAVAAGSLMLFDYLKNNKEFNIELDYTFAHAVEIVQRLVRHDFDNPPDLCVLGIGPSVTLLHRYKQLRYLPLMRLPRISQKVVIPKGASGGPNAFESSDYYFLKDELSGPSIYFDEMVRSRVFNPQRVRSSHVDADEALSLLNSASSEVKAILYFPHFNLNCIENDCTLLSNDEGHASHDEFFLFAHESLLRDSKRARLLDIAIRDAWLELRSSRDTLKAKVNSVIENESFFKSLKRFTGWADRYER